MASVDRVRLRSKKRWLLLLIRGWQEGKLLINPIRKAKLTEGRLTAGVDGSTCTCAASISDVGQGVGDPTSQYM